MARRVDLLFEIDTTLDGGGDYASEWIDTAGIDKVRVFTVNAGNHRYIDQSMDGTNVLFSDPANSSANDIPIIARYVRVSVVDGTPSEVFRAAVRAVFF